MFYAAYLSHISYLLLNQLAVPFVNVKQVGVLSWQLQLSVSRTRTDHPEKHPVLGKLSNISVQAFNGIGGIDYFSDLRRKVK